ncbi:hypothetical protein F53441_11362 [Fusarium austroafricanum]|uniref:Uncharacterized protein n=1 Tax=Fusarium austroafricanum TaxID=2364996 RepID=A0A8H4NMG8_9HYPO|nr:hypothetical protein F53441_11362 [Fusarium austroafricanum]
MKWATSQDNTLLRARQIRRYHDKHQNSGPLPHADKITDADLEFAISLAPFWRLEECEEGELEYPPQWKALPRSLTYMLRNFRKTAPSMTNKGPDRSQLLSDLEVERSVVVALKLQLEETEKQLKVGREAFKKVEDLRDSYLARAEKAEAELERLEGLKE